MNSIENKVASQLDYDEMIRVPCITVAYISRGVSLRQRIATVGTRTSTCSYGYPEPWERLLAPPK